MEHAPKVAAKAGSTPRRVNAYHALKAAPRAEIISAVSHAAQTW